MTPWMALVLLDAVTVATFARCFNGPGELALVVPVCVGAHLLAHLARRVGRNGHSLGGYGLWALTALLVAFVPVVLVDGSTFTWGLPLGATQHVLAHQMHVAWLIFSARVAPVTESRGLVIATAWAAGVLGLAAEALDADSALPAVVALVPAFDIVVFTGTLGTPTGRAPELAALAALAVWYLAGTTRHAAGEQVVTARVEGTSTSGGTRAFTSGGRRRIGLRTPPAATGLVIVAGLAAGVVGPLFPGATSAPFVAWHGSGKSSPLNAGGHNGGFVGPIALSNLVQVGEEEIDNANTPLFKVYGSTPTREVVAILDGFNGNEFFRTANGPEHPVPPFAGSTAALEANPPKPVLGKDSEEVTQVISNIDFGGDELPSPGTPIDLGGDAGASMQGSDGPLVVAPGVLGTNDYTYAIQAALTTEPAVAQEFYDPKLALGSDSLDLLVPGHVPAAIVNLAHSLVQSTMNEDEKATAIQDFLLSPPFKYSLPKTAPTSANSGYPAVSSFLFTRRTGYCQQFASAFALLARIDGLPTRLAVGYLEARPTHDSWTVTGADAHTWPQVYFPGTGWVDFEPTPSAGTPPYPNITPTTVAVITTVPTTSPTTRSSIPHCRSCQPFPGPTIASAGFRFPKAPPQALHPVAPLSSGSGSGDVLDLLLAVLAGCLLWALVIPTWRQVRDRRRRDPIRQVLLAWREAVVALAAAGLHRRRAETFQEFARRVRVAGLLNSDAETAFDRLAETSNRALFGRRRLTEDDSRRAVRDSVAVRRAARHSMAWWAKILLQLDPRDLLARP